jgi:hypothetical protein
MRFDVAGPFDLDRIGKKRIITADSIKNLRSQLEEWDSGPRFYQRAEGSPT